MCRSQLLKWVGCTLLVLQGFAWAEDGMVSNLSDTSNVTPRSAVVETTVLGDTTAAPAQVETTRAATSDSLAGAQSNEKAETGGTAQKELKGTASRLEDMFSPGKILAAVVIFLAAYLIIRILMFVLTVLGERVSQHRLKFMKLIPIVRISTWLLAVHLAIVEVFQPSTEALLAFTASAGIAIGFASQDILKNIFGGIIIILDRPFQVGDKIQVGSHYGEVVSIGLRTVRIVTADDSLVSIPNSELVNQSVSNSNAGVLDCQVGVEFRLPYDVDLQKARAILFEAAATSRYIYLKKPIAVVVQDEFKEWFLTRIKVKAYVLDNRFEFAFASEIAETAKAAFNRMGIYPIEQVGVPLAAHGARSHEQTQDGDQEFPVKNPIERRTENK